MAPGWRGAAKELGWIDIEHSPQVLRLFACSFNLQVFAKSPEMGLFFLLGCLVACLAVSLHMQESWHWTGTKRTSPNLGFVEILHSDTECCTWQNV